MQNLPDDLHHHISTFMGARDLAGGTRVAQSWRTVASRAGIDRRGRR